MNKHAPWTIGSNVQLYRMQSFRIATARMHFYNGKKIFKETKEKYGDIANREEFSFVREVLLWQLFRNVSPSFTRLFFLFSALSAMCINWLYDSYAPIFSKRSAISFSVNYYECLTLLYSVVFHLNNYALITKLNHSDGLHYKSQFARCKTKLSSLSDGAHRGLCESVCIITKHFFTLSLRARKEEEKTFQINFPFSFQPRIAKAKPG